MRVVERADRVVSAEWMAPSPFERLRPSRRRFIMWPRASMSLGLAATLGRFLEREPDALDRDAVGERMIARRAIGFEAVRQRIEPGADRDEAAACRPSAGVGDDDFRHHQRVEDHLLGVRRLVGDDAGAAGLRAGAGGGRHRDDGEDALGSARVHQSSMSSKSHIGRVWPAMKAMTLAVSSPEPPPKAMTLSCPPARSTAMPASTLAETGFGFTSENTRDRDAGILQIDRRAASPAGRRGRRR